MPLFAGVSQFQCRYLLEFPNSNGVICWSFPIPMPLFAGVSQFQWRYLLELPNSNAKQTRIFTV